MNRFPMAKKAAISDTHVHIQTYGLPIHFSTYRLFSRGDD